MQSNTTATVLGKTQVCERLGLSERTLETMVKSGAFPPPVRLGKRVYWSESAVQKWHTALFASQEAWTPQSLQDQPHPGPTQSHL